MESQKSPIVACFPVSIGLLLRDEYFFGGGGLIKLKNNIFTYFHDSNCNTHIVICVVNINNFELYEGV